MGSLPGEDSGRRSMSARVLIPLSFGVQGIGYCLMNVFTMKQGKRPDE